MTTKRNLIQLCLLGALMWPAFISSAQTVTKIAAGGYHSLFLKSDGSLWAMGLDYYGELGDGVIRPVSPYATNQPEMILGPNLSRTVTAIAAGFEHSLFLKDDDSFWAMGYNNVGELGYSSTNYSLIPLIILPGSTAVVVTNISTEAGAEHDLILKSDGSLWAVGLNSYGQLGNNTENNYFTTPQLVVPSGVTAISAGAYHSLFLKTGGSLWAMGLNSHGQLGDGTSDNGFFETNSPEMIVSSGVTAISGGGYHSLFLKNDGSLWGMGTNGDGELGDGTLFQKISPEMIISSNVTAIAAGGYFSLFLKNEGSLWGMGKNEHGQLGDGTTANAYTPEMIVSNGVVAIAAGGGHSLFIKSDGSLWGMGFNNQGQLGIGTYTSTNRPVLIVPGSGTSSGSIKISVQLLSGGKVQLAMTGIAGTNYALDRTFNLAPPNWVPQVTNVAGTGGTLIFTNTPNPATNNFWRIRSVP